MEFLVKYWKKNKKTGTQRILAYGDELTYERILFGSVLDKVCESNYHQDYFYAFLNNHLFIKRKSANLFMCTYEVQLYDKRDWNKLVADYIVEIENILADKNEDILEELYEYETKEVSHAKEEQLTEWFENESGATRRFLMALHREGSLKNLKKSPLMTKATYYRNLRICENKGYIKDGKLVKRISVVKTVKNK